MATLRGLANNRVSEAADDPAYGHVTTHTESYEAPKRRNSEERVTKERAIWGCNYCDGELSGLILGRVRGNLAGLLLLAMACDISCCDAVPQKWRSYLRRCSATSRWKRATRQSSSARVTSPPRHSSRRSTRAGSRRPRRGSVGCRPATPTTLATAALFPGADIPHVIINFQLWKDVVKVLRAAPASYMPVAPNRNRLLATLLALPAPPLRPIHVHPRRGCIKPPVNT